MPLNTPRPAPQQVIAIFFALYWALFLPFICWGVWATPGHPHAQPHLVFVVPQHAARTDPDHHHAAIHGAEPDLTRCVSGGMPTESGIEPNISAQLDSCEMAPGPADVAGQSLPSTMAGTILVLIASGAEHWEISPVLQRHRTQAHFFPSDFMVTVPEPPPRIG